MMKYLELLIPYSTGYSELHAIGAASLASSLACVIISTTAQGGADLDPG